SSGASFAALRPSCRVLQQEHHTESVRHVATTCRREMVLAAQPIATANSARSHHELPPLNLSASLVTKARNCAYVYTHACRTYRDHSGSASRSTLARTRGGSSRAVSR